MPLENHSRTDVIEGEDHRRRSRDERTGYLRTYRSRSIPASREYDSSSDRNLIPKSLALRQLFFLKSTSTIYIESFARLTRLSLSGKLVRPIVDRFFVQWEGLRDHLTAGDSDAEMDGRWRLKARAEYQGWLV